jgi:hypothetical protein
MHPLFGSLSSSMTYLVLIWALWCVINATLGD